MCPLKVFMRCHSWVCLVCSIMQEDLETLLALERADIIAQYHQVSPRQVPQMLEHLLEVETIPARAGEVQVGIRAKDEPGQPRQGP